MAKKLFYESPEIDIKASYLTNVVVCSGAEDGVDDDVFKSDNEYGDLWG